MKGSEKQRLVIRQPDDWHVHLRDRATLRAVLPFTARQFGRAIIMPNLVPPVTTTAAALAYRRRILRALGRHTTFQPLMTCYLTDATDPHDLAAGWRQGVLTAAKLYPAHATTNSAAGVTDVTKLVVVFETMQRLGMPLLLHGEATDRDVDVFDRESVFIDRVLSPLRRDFPALKIVLEHITTAEAVAYVGDAGDGLAATITPHHLVINRNALFAGGLRPHMYCLPVAKREKHRLALRRAATSGSPKFFLGTDTAPHPARAKEAACGCAGIFCAPVALEVYAQVFDEERALERLEAFAAINGAQFYGLPLNERWIALAKAATDVAPAVRVGHDKIVPFQAGARLPWRFAGLVDDTDVVRRVARRKATGDDTRRAAGR